MPRIRIIGLVNGDPSPLDGKWLKAYDPSVACPGGAYDGGYLEVTDDPSQAMQFPNAGAAIEKWREPFGLRADGEPNRPLTAWTVEIVENMPTHNMPWILIL